MGMHCSESVGKRRARTGALFTILFNAIPTISFCTFIPVNSSNRQPVGQVLLCVCVFLCVYMYVCSALHFTTSL